MRKHSLNGKSFTKLLGFRPDFSACLLRVAVIALFAGCAILISRIRISEITFDLTPYNNIRLAKVFPKSNRAQVNSSTPCFCLSGDLPTQFQIQSRGERI